jgi:hypothetical protein
MEGKGRKERKGRKRKEKKGKERKTERIESFIMPRVLKIINSHFLFYKADGQTAGKKMLFSQDHRTVQSPFPSYYAACLCHSTSV